MKVDHIAEYLTRDQAIELFDGNQSELARVLGISRQAVHKRAPNDPVPEWWVARIREIMRTES